MRSGICKLCLEPGELQLSHYLPKSVYRHFYAPALPNPNPVLVRRNGPAVQVSDQLTGYVLCRNCEQLFNDEGEDWVLRHLASVQEFPIWQILHESDPFAFDDDRIVYHGASIPQIDMDKLTYFGASVFWRGSAHDWKDRKGATHGIQLGPYEEPLRQFLLKKAPFPANMALMISIWRMNQPWICAYSPTRGDTDSYHTYLFYIPGIQFLLSVGRSTPEETRYCCSATTPERVIFADHAVHRNVRRAFRSLFEDPSSVRLIRKTLQDIAEIRAKAAVKE